MAPASRADLELEIATLRRALEPQQAKSAELEARLTDVIVLRVDGDMLRLVAHHGACSR